MCEKAVDLGWIYPAHNILFYSQDIKQMNLEQKYGPA